MVNPDKLKSLVDQQSAGPSAAALGIAPTSMEGDDDDDEEGEVADEPSDGDPVGRGNSLLAEWGEFGKALEEEADMIYDNAHEVGANLLLQKVPEDALKAVGKSVDRMPDELSMGLAKYVGELSPDDCEALGNALAAKLGEDAADVPLMCAYLQRAGEYAKAEIDVDDDFNAPEETDEPEEAPADDAADDAPPEPPVA